MGTVLTKFSFFWGVAKSLVAHYYPFELGQKYSIRPLCFSLTISVGPALTAAVSPAPVLGIGRGGNA